MGWNKAIELPLLLIIVQGTPGSPKLPSYLAVSGSMTHPPRTPHIHIPSAQGSGVTQQCFVLQVYLWAGLGKSLISQVGHCVDLYLGGSRNRVLGRHQEWLNPGIMLLIAMIWAHL